MTIAYKSSPINWIILSILILTAVGGLLWGNYRFSARNPGGNDFLPHWIGARAFIFDGISPYSEEVALRAQNIVLGHPAAQGQNENRVTYPLYSELLFAPFAFIADYTLARAVWMTVLEISLIIISLLSLSLVKWRPPVWLLTVYFIFTLLWYHAARAVINGNAVIIIGLLLTGAFLAIRNGRDEIAGFLLAYSTINPQLVFVIILFILFWSVSQRRWKIIGWFFGSLAALIVLGIFFIPNWITQNIWEVIRSAAYNPAGTLGEVLGGWMPGIATQLKWGITILFGLILFWEWWSARQKDFTWFLWTASLTLVVSQWIGIPTNPGNFIFLFPALVLILSGWDKRWKKHGNWIALTAILILLLGLWSLSLNYTSQLAQDPIMFIPFPAFLLFGLYWIKWWIVRPARLVLE
ncbi:MAG: hypothetical protein DRI56_00955 [Chloroflexota bacterium]|nr:MAG: hypothetical protein DRI56_00955 [Chloroflexota bacterium]